MIVRYQMRVVGTPLQDLSGQCITVLASLVSGDALKLQTFFRGERNSLGFQEIGTNRIYLFFAL